LASIKSQNAQSSNKTVEEPVLCTLFHFILGLHKSVNELGIFRKCIQTRPGANEECQGAQPSKPILEEFFKFGRLEFSTASPYPLKATFILTCHQYEHLHFDHYYCLICQAQTIISTNIYCNGNLKYWQLFSIQRVQCKKQVTRVTRFLQFIMEFESH